MRKGFKIVVSFLISYIVGANLFFIFVDSSFLREFSFAPISTFFKAPLMFAISIPMGLAFGGGIAVIYIISGAFLMILAISFIVYKYIIEFLFGLLKRPLLLVTFILVCIAAGIMFVFELQLGEIPL